MNYEKVRQATELLFDSDVGFVLSYRTEGNTVQTARNTNYKDLFACTTGTLIEFTTTCAKTDGSLSDMAEELENMVKQATKAAKKIKEVQ